MKLHHPDLDQTVEVPDLADLRVYERNGWARVTVSEAATEPDEPGPLLPDATADDSGDKPKRSSRS